MTTGADRFAGAAARFRGAGLEPVPLPCIRVEPSTADVLSAVREAAETAGLLVITSVRTLDLIWPDGALPPVPLAVVGERTAEAARARGAEVVVTGRAGLADLAERAGHRLGSGRVVYPHAAGTGAGPLAAIGPNLLAFEVYRTVPLAPGVDLVRAAAFASPSAVKGWLLSRTFDGLVVGVIGPTTRKAVARHRPPEVEAPRPSYRALAEALASYLEVAP